MNITTRIDGTTARITPHGAIDHDTAPALRMMLAALPVSVTRVAWDLHDVTFMDSAALHLITDPPPVDAPSRRMAVTGLKSQATELLRTAAELLPELKMPNLADPRDERPDTGQIAADKPMA
ncbi:STAS domain-containing protein [Streptomyces sp. NPDC058193]|uniref:STAS domain-containing protein n=1 Tax=Streptomyces sp. NPDC058193 TaxID=3346373 RepID=UPI0036E6A813